MENIAIPTDLNFEKVWLGFQEVKEMLKQTFQEIAVQSKETDKKFQNTDKKFQETRDEIRALSGLFTTQWGKLMEALIEPSCLKLFRDRKIDVSESYTNLKSHREGESAEHDIVLANGKEVVVISVKTTMTINYVNEFVEDIERFKFFFPRWKNEIIYGAIAGIKYVEQSDRYAYRQGLFVLKNAGEGIIKIANSEKFTPKAY